MAAKKEEKKEEAPKELKETPQATAPASKSSKETRWKKFLQAAKVQNPVKYEIKEKNGEFKKIPDSFK